ncbi:3'(2'),5'-bisphosphate nucleotidase CysQ [Ostreiculturibacter nitratireducens]|uniref:3'(2'),5'-bisphosphate nucleotidase CysQ n=1 Tax=Ostreiculturibacter nitratireducens TaxID=3075226 RepID=UPI0031B614A1
MPANDLFLLIEAAREAGTIALRHWRNRPKVWEKPEGAGPVTEADLAVNAMLERELAAARPGYGWLSEETEDDPARLSAERTFIVDPIDGTRAFLEGDKTFAHALAVAEAGRVTAAVVHLPALNLTFAAAEDGPATLNGQPIAASGTSRTGGATVLTARWALSPEHWQGRPPAVRREFRASMAYRLCLVAQGRFDAALSLRPTWEWDIAAGDLIARRAGAAVTDRHGGAIAYNRPEPRAEGILAAPPGLHADLIGRLTPALRVPDARA